VCPEVAWISSREGPKGTPHKGSSRHLTTQSRVCGNLEVTDLSRPLDLGYPYLFVIMSVEAPDSNGVIPRAAADAGQLHSSQSSQSSHRFLPFYLVCPRVSLIRTVFHALLDASTAHLGPEKAPPSSKRRRFDARNAGTCPCGPSAGMSALVSTSGGESSTIDDEEEAKVPTTPTPPSKHDVELKLDHESDMQLTIGGSNKVLPDTIIAKYRNSVATLTLDVGRTYALLGELRKLILSHGSLAQVQVCNDDVIFQGILTLIMGLDLAPKLTEAGCRVLCTLVAKNPTTQALVSRLPAAVERLASIVLDSADHVAVGCEPCATQVPPLVADTDSFPANPCAVSARACAAMWALTALVMKNVPFQTEFCKRRAVLKAVEVHLGSSNEESVSASAWLLCNAVMGAPALSRAVMGSLHDRTRLVTALVSALRSPHKNAKGLVCWAIRALSVENKEHQQAFVDNGVLPALLSSLVAEDVTLQASAVWALGSLANGVPAIQDAIGADNDMMKTLVCLLESSSQQVQNQAAGALYNIAARHPGNQTTFGDLGAIPKLINILPKQQGSVKFVEKVIAALLCLALKHSANQQRVGRAQDFGPLAVKFLSCSSPRVQGLGAGLIRTVVAEQQDLQLLFASHGALSALLELAQSKDSFCQEQAVAAMYNMLAQQSLNKSLLRILEPERLLVALLCDCTKPTLLAYTCAVMVLFVLTEDDAAFTAKLGSMKPLVDALLLFCHPKCSDPRLRAQADRLLKTISPACHAERQLLSPAAVLDAMIAFPVSALGPRCTGDEFACPVCFEGKPDDVVVRLPCGHVLHKHCMHAFFSHGRDTCPCCRDNVVAAVHKAIGSETVLEASK
jgi:hypothetical protein